MDAVVDALARQFRQALAKEPALKLPELKRWIPTWFDDHASPLGGLGRFAVLQQPAVKARLLKEAKAARLKRKGYLRWRLRLLSQVLPECDPGKAWPPPIHSRVNSVYVLNKTPRIDDYVQLYEVLIHFHFVVLASQFFAVADPLSGEALPGEVERRALTTGYWVLYCALNDPTSMGGRVWLHRAGGLTHVLHALRALGSPPLARLVDILEPEHLRLHQSFGIGRGRDEVVAKGGPVFDVFNLLQEVRNKLFAHSDPYVHDDEVAAGIESVLGLASTRFAPYRDLGLAEVGSLSANLKLTGLWTEEGYHVSSTQRTKRQTFFALWGRPEPIHADIVAPAPPSLRGWEPGWWDESLLLFDRTAARRECLYLMPWAFANTDGDGDPRPALLDQVTWQPLGGRNINVEIEQRYYKGEPEGTVKGHSAAENSVRAIMARIEQTCGLGPEFSAPGTAVPLRSFDLGHAQRALDLAESTFPRDDEVERLLETARGAAKERGDSCGLVMLVGESGSGKSVLLAQAFAHVEERAMFFTMDRAPEPDYEPAAPDAGRRPLSGEPSGATGAAGGTIPDSLKKPEGSAPAPTPDSPPSVAGLAGRTESAAARTIAVPIRMHWLAGVCRLAGQGQPRTFESVTEASQRIADLLRHAVADPAGEPVYIFIDAVNQADSPEALLSGLLPLSRLPSGVVVVVSTQDVEDVLRVLRGSPRAPYPWQRLDVAPLSSDETVAVMRQGWPDGLPFPELGPQLKALLHERVGGLPIVARHWGKQFQDFVRQEGPLLGALKLQGELEQARAGAIPPEYLERLQEEVWRDFTPARLPEVLVWCLSIVADAMDRESLYAAVAAVRAVPELRAQFPQLPEVARAEIDAALARVGGFLVSDRTTSARRWRLAHPSLGEAWLANWGTPSLIGRLNVTLLAFGATPDVEKWSTADAERWLTLTIERSAHYDLLTLGQRDVLLQGLLRRLASDRSLAHVAHRRSALRRQQALLMFDRGEVEPSRALTQEIYDDLQARLAGQHSREVKADLLFDLGGAVNSLGYFEPPRAEELYEKAVQSFEASRRLCPEPERWSTLRSVRLITAQYNLALVQGNVGRHAEALGLLNEAVALGATLDQAMPEVREELADCRGLRGWQLARLGRRDEAIADYGADIALRESLDRDRPKRREQLANALYTRANELAAAERVDEAVTDDDRAIALYHTLDQGQPDARESLANAYHARATHHTSLGRYPAAGADYRAALALFATLEQTPARLAFVGTCQYQLAAALGAAGEFEEAARQYAAAIATFGAVPPADVDVRAALAEAYRGRALLQRQHGRRDQALADYESAPEPVLLRNTEFGVLLQSAGPEDSAQEALPRLSDAARFLAFEPLPDHLLDWARAQVGLDGPEFAELRERVTFRAAPLAFYADGYLLVAEDTARRGRRELFALCRLGGEVVGLDWTNGPIYATNVRWGIQLEAPEQVLQYCRVFFQFVHGRHGPFDIFDDVDELPWTTAASEADVAPVRAVFAPLTVVPSTQGGMQQLDARIVFKDALFASTIHVRLVGDGVEDRGQIKLSGDSVLVENMPIRLPISPLIRDEEAPDPDTEAPDTEAPDEPPAAGGA